MKTLKLALIASTLLVSANADQVLNVKSGWNLVGSSLNNVTTDSFNNSAVASVWGWDNKNMKFKAYSPIADIDKKIKEYVSKGKLENLDKLNKGDGFWVNATADAALNLKGTASSDISKVLAPGWNLISFTGGEKNIADIFKQNAAVKIVWTYDNGWKGWSPNDYMTKLIANMVGDKNIIKTVKPNVGYWVYAQMASTVGINLTPSANVNQVIFVYQMGSSNNIIPVANATLLVNGKVIGQTNEAGEFDFSSLGLSDGTSVTVMKPGFTTTTGVIQNGALTLAIAPLAIDNSLMPPQTPELSRVLVKNQGIAYIPQKAEGNEIPLPNLALISLDGGTMEISGSSSVGSVSVFLTLYNTPSEIPAITNNITVPVDESSALSPTVLPKELSIIGGANITLRKADGSLVTDLSEYDNTGLSYKIELDRFIGDFGKILEGLTGSTIDNADKFNEEVIKQLENAKAKGLIDFYVLLQQKDGTWKYIDKAKFVKVADRYVMVPESNEKLSEFGAGNIAYVIRTKALTGTTKVCLKYDGERMFDGTIVPDEMTGKPVVGATIVPDEHVIAQPAPTGEDGCTNIEYKVPFLAPMYHVTAVKNGMYNEPVTVEIQYGNLNSEVDENASLKPKDVSIKGYVFKTLNNIDTPVKNAVVALRDPQILVAEKIKINSQEDNNSIELIADPNLEYTWILTKDDSNAKVTIKTGNAKNGNNVLTENEIENIIYNPDSNINPWADKPYGHYYIDVIVKHNYAQGEQASFTESMTIEFDAQVDEPALVRAFDMSVNQGDAAVYNIDENGNIRIVDDINTSANPPTSEELASVKVPITSIFGGKDLGWFEPVIRSADPNNPYSIIMADKTVWITDVFALESNTSDLCIDMSDPDDAQNPYYKYIIKTYGPAGYCIAKVTPKTTFDGQIMPFSRVYKMFIDNFKDITAPDPGYNNKPFYQSGFTVTNTYKAEFNRKAMNKGVYKTYVVSYTSLQSDKFKKVSDFSNVINFDAKTNEAIAFDTRIALTDVDGSYRIDHIAPNVVPNLELMARAEGTLYNTKNFRKANYPDAVYTGNLESNISGETDQYIDLDGESAYTPNAGDVLVHNFHLDAIPQTDILMDFEHNLTDNLGNTWTIEKLNISDAYINAPISDKAVWHVVNNANLPTLNSNYLADVFENSDDAPQTILKTPFGENYAWMGNLDTGTYSDSGEFVHSGTQVATALKSPVIDFSNYSLATLQLKTWFEVAGIDAAWDTAFIGFEIVDENNTGGSEIPLTYYNGYTWNVKVNQLYIHRLTPSSPIVSNYDATLFSNNGVNTLPTWRDYQIPLDFLAGHKARIVFGFFTADDLYNNFRGWGVDDIKIKDNVDYVIQTPPMPEMFDEGVEPVEGNATQITE